MRKLASPTRLLAAATLPMIVLSMAYPASAASPAAASGIHAAAALRLAAAAAPSDRASPSDGMSPTPTAPPSDGMSPTPAAPAAPHPAFIRPPFPIPTRPVAVLPGPNVAAPGTYPLQASASAVTVSWYDRSDNELGFKVFKRDLSGNWQTVYQVPTRDMAGSTDGLHTGGIDNYTWVDTSTDVSGQCYMLAAYNATDIAYTSEECTVRPDPSRFPQAVGQYAVMWSGLSNVNDGTGDLVNTHIEQDLLYGNQTWGVNLTWGDSSLWRVEAQGGPHLMKGQAVALRVWGGGWLKYGHQTWGVDLQLSSTPVYEWYAIGLQGDASESTWAGHDLTDGGTFALWNSSAQAYLVYGHETFGINLAWYRVGNGSTPTPTPGPTQRGVKTERVFNCSVDQHAVEVFVADQTTGAGFVDLGSVGEQYGAGGCPYAGSVPLTFSPQSGHHYLLVATDKSLPTCDGTDDPQEGGCQKMVAQFDGDANGYTRTDIVDIGTQITP